MARDVIELGRVVARQAGKNIQRGAAMGIVGILIVSPLWGIGSTVLFVQSWLAAFSFLFAFIGVIRGEVERKSNLMFMGISVLQVILFSGGLAVGQFVLGNVLHFGSSDAENWVYWIVAAITLFFTLPEMVVKVRHSWKMSNMVGALEEDIFRRRLSQRGGDHENG